MTTRLLFLQQSNSKEDTADANEKDPEGQLAAASDKQSCRESDDGQSQGLILPAHRKHPLHTLYAGGNFDYSLSKTSRQTERT